MTRLYVELSGESAALARAEAIGAAEALGGGAPANDPIDRPGLVALEVPNERLVAVLAGRLALARRCIALAAEPP
ncbi:MAG: hypothetical protein WBF81_07225, partial [Thermoplasmata archaeon]